MGLGTQDSYHVQRIMQEILDRQSALTEARQKYGARHARIRALETELAVKEKYLKEFPELQRLRTDTMTRDVLAPRLVPRCRHCRHRLYPQARVPQRWPQRRFALTWSCIPLGWVCGWYE